MFTGFEDGGFDMVVFQSSDHVWNVNELSWKKEQIKGQVLLEWSTTLHLQFLQFACRLRNQLCEVPDHNIPAWNKKATKNGQSADLEVIGSFGMLPSYVTPQS